MGGFKRAAGRCSESLEQPCVERYGEKRMVGRFVEISSASTGLQQAHEV